MVTSTGCFCPHWLPVILSRKLWQLREFGHQFIQFRNLVLASGSGILVQISDPYILLMLFVLLLFGAIGYVNGALIRQRAVRIGWCPGVIIVVVGGVLVLRWRHFEKVHSVVLAGQHARTNYENYVDGWILSNGYTTFADRQLRAE